MQADHGDQNDHEHDAAAAAAAQDMAANLTAAAMHLSVVGASGMHGGGMMVDDHDRDKQMTSRYRGVCWNKKNRRWQAAINSSGKYLYLGSFMSEEEAASMFDQAAIRLRGNRAKLNFHLEDYLQPNGELLEDPRIASIMQKAEANAVAAGATNASLKASRAAAVGPSDMQVALSGQHYGDLLGGGGMGGGGRGVTSGAGGMHSTPDAPGGGFTVPANAFKGKPLHVLDVPLPPGCTAEATVPAEDDAFGVLYLNQDRVLGAVIWDGFASQDLGVYDTDRDAHNACRSALRIVLQYKNQNALLLQSLAESMLPSSSMVAGGSGGNNNSGGAPILGSRPGVPGGLAPQQQPPQQPRATSPYPGQSTMPAGGSGGIGGGGGQMPMPAMTVGMFQQALNDTGSGAAAGLGGGMGNGANGVMAGVAGGMTGGLDTQPLNLAGLMGMGGVGALGMGAAMGGVGGSMGPGSGGGGSTGMGGVAGMAGALTAMSGGLPGGAGLAGIAVGGQQGAGGGAGNGAGDAGASGRPYAELFSFLQGYPANKGGPDAAAAMQLGRGISAMDGSAAGIMPPSGLLPPTAATAAGTHGDAPPVFSPDAATAGMKRGADDNGLDGECYGEDGPDSKRQVLFSVGGDGGGGEPAAHVAAAVAAAAAAAAAGAAAGDMGASAGAGDAGAGGAAPGGGAAANAAFDAMRSLAGVSVADLMKQLNAEQAAAAAANQG